MNNDEAKSNVSKRGPKVNSKQDFSFIIMVSKVPKCYALFDTLF